MEIEYLDICLRKIELLEKGDDEEYTILLPFRIRNTTPNYL